MATVVDPKPVLLRRSEPNDVSPPSHSNVGQEPWEEPTNGVAPEQYTGKGEDDLPRSPVRKVIKKSSSSRMNGHTRNSEGSLSSLVVEKFQDRDGEHLTTIKQFHRNGQQQNQRSDELLSGRRVGTKWERYKCDEQARYLGSGS